MRNYGRIIYSTILGLALGSAVYCNSGFFKGRKTNPVNSESKIETIINSQSSGYVPLNQRTLPPSNVPGLKKNKEEDSLKSPYKPSLPSLPAPSPPAPSPPELNEEMDDNIPNPPRIPQPDKKYEKNNVA